MKKLLIILLMLSLYSCSEKKPKMIGVWRQSHGINEKGVEMKFPDASNPDKVTFTFKEDGSVTWKRRDVQNSNHWRLSSNGDTLYLKDPKKEKEEVLLVQAYSEQEFTLKFPSGLTMSFAREE